ncbi:uncharacterized protein LOC143273220 [Peromyscus maniculatus bairdii]|uniref:uncharacterized protein LOC143273220 n=1 Tax=Peromyscus maniculatus bairdii TaxID=230844 RepID=UPI003FCF8482
MSFNKLQLLTLVDSEIGHTEISHTRLVTLRFCSKNHFTETLTGSCPALPRASSSLLGHSYRLGGMGGMVRKTNIKTGGDPSNLRKALVNNLGEEKRTKLHIQKLQKALALRFREIDKEKAALKKFLVKLQKTTGYFPQRELW